MPEKTHTDDFCYFFSRIRNLFKLILSIIISIVSIINKTCNLLTKKEECVRERESDRDGKRVNLTPTNCVCQHSYGVCVCVSLYVFLHR